MIRFFRILLVVFSFWFYLGGAILEGQSNPFLQPGSQNRKPPPVIKSTPLPPSPKPINSNLQFRGYYKFQGVWHFALFDKVKNRGYWLQQGESLDNGKVTIDSFNEVEESVKIKGGQTLRLENSQHKVMPVPSAQPVKKASVLPPKTTGAVRSPTTTLPRVKIPPRKPTPPKLPR